MKYKYTKHGDELRFNYCPICDKVKENPDFAINTAEGVYFCLSVELLLFRLFIFD